MSRINWSKRKPVYIPWYERLDADPFGAPSKITERRARPPAKPSQPKQPIVETAHKRLAMPTGAFAGRAALRTSDYAEARAALAGAAWAIVHTDGGASPNPGPGGFGAVLRSEGLAVDLFGGKVRSTNNRMELLAAISALEVLPKACRVTIVSDSKYVVLGASQWMTGWRRKGWLRDGKPLPNDDLWRRLNALMNGRSIKWQWTKGHNGHRLNEIADKLAALGRTGGRS